MRKWAKDLNRYFSKEVMRKMLRTISHQGNATLLIMRYYYIITRMAKISGVLINI